VCGILPFIHSAARFSIYLSINPPRSDRARRAASAAPTYDAGSRNCHCEMALLLMLVPTLAAPAPPSQPAPLGAGCLCTSEETTCMSGGVNVSRACGCQDSGDGNSWCFVANQSTCVGAEQACSPWVAHPFATPPRATSPKRTHCTGRCRTHTFGRPPPPASSTVCVTCRPRGLLPHHRPLQRPRYHQDPCYHRHRRLSRHSHRHPLRRRRFPPTPHPPPRPHRAHD
jgi:hypothetical protein